MIKRLSVFLLLFANIAGIALAQVYVMGGLHQSYVRNKVLVGDSPIYDWHIGGGVVVKPNVKWNKILLNAEIGFIKKGYDQHLGNQSFNLRFSYITWQASLSYKVLPFLSIRGGVNFAGLVDVNVKKWLGTYKSSDIGLMGGLSFFEHKKLGFYTQVIYGLTPVLTYYTIDSLGNFGKDIHDLKNTCFMIGLRINLYDKNQFIQL